MYDAERDTAEPVSRDHILRRERGQGNISFPCSADHVQDCGNLTRLIHTLAICVTIHNTHMFLTKRFDTLERFRYVQILL